MIRGLTGEREEPVARTRRGVKLGANLHSSEGWRTAINSNAAKTPGQARSNTASSREHSFSMHSRQGHGDGDIDADHPNINLGLEPVHAHTDSEMCNFPDR